jgi:phosphoribosylaminoimidazole-succinocarboxamide synthase
MPEVVTTTNLEGVELLRRGKVRDVYQIDSHLLIVASDRISAFDCVIPNGIPHKGAVLTQISRFWFERLEDLVPNHLVTTNVDEFPAQLAPYRDTLAGRSMLVRKADRLDVECVARGYLIGSGWVDYQDSGAVCGIDLPAGLPMAGQLPETIFTPASKADDGHDENISFAVVEDMVGADTASRLRDLSLRIYGEARAYAEERGIIIADTKFEFGFVDGELILIDEVLTPDSSRFWPADDYQVGSSPPSFDKQYVRDYLLGVDWDRNPPAPELPPEVIEATSAKYLEAFRRLTGQELPGTGG